MAKRKRLAPLDAPVSNQPARPFISRATAPIADVAFDAANSAAMTEMADTLQRIQTEERMIVSLSLDQIVADHLVRDRLATDPDEMDALVSSIRVRGQQSPIEVVAIGTTAEPRYGLISGWRRLQALHYLARETNDAQFQTVLALERKPNNAADTYLAMVEENEIRVGLSFYERARVTAKAVELQVYPTEKQALNGLFGSVSRAKRSKIKTFIRIVESLDDILLFPSSIAERIGLALGRALQTDPNLVVQLRKQLEDASPKAADEELAILKGVIEPTNEEPPLIDQKKPFIQPADKKSNVGPHSMARETIGPGLYVQPHADGRLTLSGSALTPSLQSRLTDWLLQQLNNE